MLETWMDCPHDDDLYAKLKVAIREAQSEHFTMSFPAGEDLDMLTEIWNQGIDSRLEALTERSSAKLQSTRFGTRMAFAIHPEELPTLIRRLFEHGSENGETLAGDILSSVFAEEL